MTQVTTVQNQLPAHLASMGFAVEANSDLVGGVSQSYPIISYKGKTWHVVTGDNRDLIENDDGDPAASIEVVILKANPNLSKIYYPSGYEEGSTEKPTCYSTDSVAPAADAAEPQARKCAVCPHNQWGSRITENGAKGKACADHRRLAVAPTGDLENAMLLRVPAASLKELVAFADTLRKRGVPYQALKTKIGFDHTVAFPKLTFKAAGWLEEAEAKQVMEMLDGELIQAITALNAPSIVDVDTGPEPSTDTVLDNPPAHVTQAAAAPAKTMRTKPKPAPVSEAEIDQVLETEAAPVPTETPKKTTGGFGGKKAQAAAPVPTETPKKTTGGFGGKKAQAAAPEPVTALQEGVMAELDAALASLDD